jgi:Putative Flp pilus-assembly TadE/G-like
MTLLRRIAREERGAMAVTIGLLVPVFLLFGVLAIDIGNWYVHKRELQTQADAGALAAAAAFKFPCDDSAIDAVARSYAGGDRNVFANVPADGATYSLAINQPNFAGQGQPDETELTGHPCDDRAVDVKMTERDVPWLIRNLPLLGAHRYINARARVSLYRIDALGGTMPVALPAPDPKRVRVTFVSEVTGEVLGAKDLCKRPDAESGLELWDNAASNPAAWKASPGTCDGATAATTLPLTFNDPKYRRVVVRVQVSGSMATIGCGEQLVTCYDAGFVHGWSDQPAVTDAASSPPQPRSLVLLPGTCGDAYFSAKTSSCTVGLSAKVDFQPREYDAGRNPKSAVSVKAIVTSSAGSSSTYSLTWSPAAQAWQSSSVAVPAGAGPLDVKLTWEQTDNTVAGYGTCKTGNKNPCTDTFPDVLQRTFSASDAASGPIKLLQLGDLASTSGVNDVQRCSSAHPSCTTSFVVRVGIGGTLTLSKPTDPPTVLRVGASGGSQNQTIDCDPGLSNLEDEIALGCSPEYRRNTGQACTGSEPSGTPPLYCVAVEPGRKTNAVSAGMNRRILGTAKPSSCTSTNHWPNFDPGDPRIVPVMIVPYGSFQSSGGGTGTEVPVQDFAYFYVTGWTGQGNGFDNPCQGNGDDAVPGNDSAYIVGHFVTHVETLNAHGDSPCDLSGNSISGCAAVMTR